MVNQVIAFIIKLSIIVLLIQFLAGKIVGVVLDNTTVVSIVVLIFVYLFIKRSAPGVLDFTKHALLWSVKTIVIWLYRKPEKRGSINVRPPRMRWRE